MDEYESMGEKPVYSYHSHQSSLGSTSTSTLTVFSTEFLQLPDLGDGGHHKEVCHCPKGSFVSCL